MAFIKLNLVFIFTLLFLVASQSTVLKPEAYWNAKLPNTPIPKSLKEMLKPEWKKDNNNGDGKEIGLLPFGRIREYYNDAPKEEIKLSKEGKNDNSNGGGKVIEPLPLDSILFYYKETPKEEVKLFKEGKKDNNNGGGKVIEPLPLESILFYYNESSKEEVQLFKEGKKDSNDSGGEVIEPLPLESILFYYNETSKKEVQSFKGVDFFFFESDIIKGRNLMFQFAGTVSKDVPFLPREEVEKVPFTSNSIPYILKHFSVKPESSEANTMKETIDYCEIPAKVQGEQRFCATSLESMIDFSISNLGKDIYALSPDVEKETPTQEYNIVGVSDILGNAAVSCHAMKYAHPVFFCHNIGTVRLYMVSLVGVEYGSRVKTVAICHTDTSGWNPNHLSFQLLNVKPGRSPICHFLSKDHVIWIPK